MKYAISQDFPLQAFQPKVQLAFHTTPENCPRKVEIERCVNCLFLYYTYFNIKILFDLIYVIIFLFCEAYGMR